MNQQAAFERAKAHFGEILEQQFSRIEAVKEEGDFIEYASLDKIVIGIIGGDGIGPALHTSS